MSISEILAKKAAADAAHEATQPKILTGAEGSVPSGQPPAPPAPDKTPDADDSLLSKYKDYPEGSYLMLRQKALILDSGARVVPDANGVIIPETDEQKELLAYFLKQDMGLVALLSEPK